MIIFLDNSDVPIGEKGTESFSWLSSEFAKRMLYDQFSRFTLVYVLKWIHCFHYMICYAFQIVFFHYTFATILDYILSWLLTLIGPGDGAKTSHLIFKAK